MAELSADELKALERILAKLSGGGAELPWPLFRFITEVSPTANVDLLVHDTAGRVLLAWRDDPFGTGWHVPGSIIRHREEIAHRIEACAEDEFGCPAEMAPSPVALIQIFDDRGHSVSLVYPATLKGTPARVVAEGVAPKEGDLRWFASMPEDLYPSHLVYREIVAAFRFGGLRTGIPVLTQHTGHRDEGWVGAGWNRHG
jgi:ADP-ribose pyrophosphatase YjhB (NUDIX family)